MTTAPLATPTYSNYSSYPCVWKPQPMGDQALFLIRVPSNLSTLSWSHYLALIHLRVQWLIRTSDQPQIQTQHYLEAALTTLNVSQEPPSLYETSQSRILAPLSLWAVTWADALIHLNDTWRTKFQIENEPLRFPCPVTHPLDRRIRQQWREEHDNMTLETWLADLTHGLSN